MHIKLAYHFPDELWFSQSGKSGLCKKYIILCFPYDTDTFLLNWLSYHCIPNLGCCTSSFKQLTSWTTTQTTPGYYLVANTAFPHRTNDIVGRIHKPLKAGPGLMYSSIVLYKQVVWDEFATDFFHIFFLEYLCPLLYFFYKIYLPYEWSFNARIYFYAQMWTILWDLTFVHVAMQKKNDQSCLIIF